MTQLASGITPTPGGLAIDWSAALASHDRWLRTVVLARLGEPQAVDEVMQEVAVAAVEQRSPLVDGSKVAPWLYRLAIRQALLYRRRRGRQRRLLERYSMTTLDATRPAEKTVDPLAWLLCKERRQLVRRSLGRLPRRDAEILLLKHGEGWSYRQMAEHLGTTVAAIQSRLHRARRRLRGQLKALDLTEADA